MRVASELVKLGIKSSRGNRKITVRTIKEWCDRTDADRKMADSILAGGIEAIAREGRKDIPRLLAVINADAMLTPKWRQRIELQPRPAARKFVLNLLRSSIQARLAGANARPADESVKGPS